MEFLNHAPFKKRNLEKKNYNKVLKNTNPDSLNSSADSDTASSNDSQAIMLAFIGTIAFVLLLVFLGYLYCKRIEKKKRA